MAVLKNTRAYLLTMSLDQPVIIDGQKQTSLYIGAGETKEVPDAVLTHRMVKDQITVGALITRSKGLPQPAASKNAKSKPVAPSGSSGKNSSPKHGGLSGKQDSPKPGGSSVSVGDGKSAGQSSGSK